jgi:tetratricopeptide (TPR) repeat protein
LDALTAWAHDPRLLEIPLEAYAFLDTETSGLAGGTGTYAFLVGVGRYEGETFHLAQFFMRDPSEEAALLEGLTDFLAPARALVTFNGKAFDAPLLRTRYRLLSVPIPFEDCAHVDLLPLSRRLWRDRLPSRALKYLEENVLGAPRTSDEVSGWEIPYLYFDYLRSGDATPLKGVFYHNAMDVIAMAALLKHVSELLAEPHTHEHEFGLDVVALARLFEDLGRWDDASRLYERGLEIGVPEADFWQAIKRLSALQRRRGDLEAAVGLWEKAAAEGHIYAYIELAKYHEHQRREPAEALKWARSALEMTKDRSLPAYIRKHWQDEIHHRLERLEGKARKDIKRSGGE